MRWMILLLFNSQSFFSTLFLAAYKCQNTRFNYLYIFVSSFHVDYLYGILHPISINTFKKKIKQHKPPWSDHFDLIQFDDI